MDADIPALQMSDIHAGYGELEILRGLDLSLTQSTITAIIGANGAGKSTLLKTLFGMVPARSGKIALGGKDITSLSSADRLRLGIVLVPQGRCNFPLMSVQENLEMGAFTRSDRGVRGDIEKQYARFPVLGLKRKVMAGSLSGGEQQLLEISMALMLSPRLVLIDEPSLGLSPMLQGKVFDAVQSLKEAGTTVLMVEQNAVQALRIADRGVVIELGRVAKSGTGVAMLDDADVRRAYLGMTV